MSVEPHTCKSCGTEIFWTTTEPGGKSMPIDSIPHPDGTFIVNRRGDKLVAIHVSRADLTTLAGRNRYVSHFSACPQASQHRKERR